jgi:hypothetical protein
MIPVVKAVVVTALAVGATIGGGAMAYADPHDWAHDRDHGHQHPGWHFFNGHGWYPGFVSPEACRRGGGHPDFRRDECEGGRFDDFLLR